MEKLAVKRKTQQNNRAINKKMTNVKLPSKNKKLKDYFKISRFFVNLKQNVKNFIILSIIFALIIVVTSIVFIHNEYYDFLNRPKVISNSITIFLMLVLSVTISYAFICLKIYSLQTPKPEQIAENVGKNSNENNKQEVALDTDKIIRQTMALTGYNNEQCSTIDTVESVDSSAKLYEHILYVSKNNETDLTHNLEKVNKRCKFKSIFMCSYLDYAAILLINLFFALHIIWICVFLGFLMIFLNIYVYFKCSNSIVLKTLNAVNLLIDLCIFFSLFLIYMLNWQNLEILEYFCRFDLK